MKKWYFFLFFVSLLSSIAHAQELRIAPVVGVNISGVAYSKSYLAGAISPLYDTRTGPLARLYLGGIIDYAFSERFSIRTGLQVSGRGGTIRLTYSQSGVSGKGKGRYMFNYLELPLMLSVALNDNGLRLVSGPVLGVALNAKSVVNVNVSGSAGRYIDSGTEKMSIGTNPSDYVRPTDLSFAIGVAKQFQMDRQGLEVGVQIQPSLSKLNPSAKLRSDYFARHWLVGFRAAYFFEVRR